MDEFINEVELLGIEGAAETTPGRAVDVFERPRIDEDGRIGPAGVVFTAVLLRTLAEAFAVAAEGNIGVTAVLTREPDGGIPGESPVGRKEPVVTDVTTVLVDNPEVRVSIDSATPVSFKLAVMFVVAAEVKGGMPTGWPRGSEGAIPVGKEELFPNEDSMVVVNEPETRVSVDSPTFVLLTPAVMFAGRPAVWSTGPEAGTPGVNPIAMEDAMVLVDVSETWTTSAPMLPGAPEGAVPLCPLVDADAVNLVDVVLEVADRVVQPENGSGPDEVAGTEVPFASPDVLLIAG